MDEILKDAKNDFAGKAAKVNERTSTAPEESGIVSEVSKSSGSGGMVADHFDAVLINAGRAANASADKTRKGFNQARTNE